MSEARTDEELLRAYAERGDGAALEALIARHWTGAFRLARCLLGDPSAAEDAAQDAMIALARGARSYRSSSFGSYFRTLVLNAARMRARTERRRRRREDRVAEGRPAADHDREGERRLVAGDVERHVQRLPADVRSAVVLRYYEGLSHEEVAAALRCPAGTASSRVRRGLEMLRGTLSAAGFAMAFPDLEGILSALGRAKVGPLPSPPSQEMIAARVAKSAAKALTAKVGSAAVAAVAVAFLLLAPRAPSPPGPSATPGSRGPAAKEEPVPATDRERSTVPEPGSPPVPGAGTAGRLAERRPGSEERTPFDNGAQLLDRALSAMEAAPFVRFTSEGVWNGRPFKVETLAAPASGCFLLHGPEDRWQLGYDGSAYWVYWTSTNEAVVLAPLAAARRDVEHEFSRRVVRAALGLPLERMGLLLAAVRVADRAPEPGTVRLSAVDDQYVLRIDRATGVLRDFEERTGDGSWTCHRRYDFGSAEEAAAFTTTLRAPVGAHESSWRVAERNGQRIVVTHVARDLRGSVLISGFRENAQFAPTQFADPEAGDWSGRDDLGVCYVQGRVSASASVPLAPLFGTPFAIALQQEHPSTGAAPLARTINVRFGDVELCGIALPEAGPEILAGDRRDHRKTEAPAPVLEPVGLPIDFVLSLLPELSTGERAQIMSLSRERRLTISRLRGLLGEARTGTLREAMHEHVPEDQVIVLKERIGPSLETPLFSLVERGDFASAIARLTPLAEKGDPKARSELASVLRTSGRLDEALRIFEALARERYRDLPNDTPGWHYVRMGFCLEPLGRLDEARAAYVRALGEPDESGHVAQAMDGLRRIAALKK